jgi:oxygen-independent coproporphyrinogen III oxidase
MRLCGPHGPVSTIFLGGGTPSLLTTPQIERIFSAIHENFRVDRGCEVTLEANPESVTLEKVRGWTSVGINRLSLGVQSLEDAVLHAAGRIHSVQEFMDAYRRARSAGFDNISLDLIYGLENQTLDSWKASVEQAVRMAPEHLSLYSLTIEKNTPFGARGMKVDTDLQADMYDWTRPFLARAGYDQYEISNFCRPGKSCRHNLIYWRQGDYIGLGLGAVGCVQGRRWENAKTFQEYFDALEAGRLPRRLSEDLDDSTRKFERLMLGLRLREGVEWGEEMDPQWLKERARLAAAGQLEEVSPGRWRIPDSAILLTNQVLLPFASADN